MSVPVEAVETHRSVIESWAASELPLAEDMAALLDEAEREGRISA